MLINAIFKVRSNLICVRDEVLISSTLKVQLLPAVNDDHGGVIIKLEEPMDPNVFHNMLRSSSHQWRLQLLVVQEGSGEMKGTGIWKIPPGIVEEIDTEFLKVLAFG